MGGRPRVAPQSTRYQDLRSSSWKKGVLSYTSSSYRQLVTERPPACKAHSLVLRCVHSELPRSCCQSRGLIKIRPETRGADLALPQQSPRRRARGHTRVSQAAATLPLSSGSLGCRSSVRLRHPARWASSADSNKMIGERHPKVAGTIFLRSSRLSTLALLTWKKQVSAPKWVQLASGDVDAPNVVDMKEPNQPKKGWQATVSRVVDAQMFCSPPCPRGTPRCGNRKGALSRRFRSRCSLLIARVGSTRSHSESCRSAGCTSRSFDCAFVHVAVSSTTWATTSRHAQLLGFSGVGDFLWRAQRPASVKKQVERCGKTFS